MFFRLRLLSLTVVMSFSWQLLFVGSPWSTASVLALYSLMLDGPAASEHQAGSTSLCQFTKHSHIMRFVVNSLRFLQLFSLSVYRKACPAHWQGLVIVHHVSLFSFLKFASQMNKDRFLFGFNTLNWAGKSVVKFCFERIQSINYRRCAQLMRAYSRVNNSALVVHTFRHLVPL